MAEILYGKPVADAVKAGLRSRIAALKEKGIQPGLAVLLVGEDPASCIYVRNKGRACEELGIYSETLRLPGDTEAAVLSAKIDELNANKRIHGILVQMPLPKPLNEQAVIRRILPEKDVDGFHPFNVGSMVQGINTFLPCTPAGILKMMEYYDIRPAGKHVVIVGRSNIVGKPMANLLCQKSPIANATVTLCHTATENLKSHTLQADILIAAAGVPAMIREDMVREGAVVIDVGVNRVPDAAARNGTRLCGDVDFDAVSRRAAAITPVPGGVGLMTIAMLMQNTVEAAEKQP
ncbi:MAG: bifunctional methylenetetrahydrofolate dehydrogenase/methenyltetrahydrofolate cyclohydrolase FolD [Candidatus Neomarinimicrobiota bacterium]|jgi:methylenetetrahydrofolate dehydrogenase (NADP+)/methenyltetrahydrofolate cyclohydrolase|nr:bifunctional methylenetetrahydrofolate dehydrogenase/methenyltetrahydrofolate cyclohydrolase FolD [Candidatus Neomarinimicrobiota bacterium]MDD3965968.1 bifunctional methylenetetrahydrofolate dehydrogenase/methenyltetrahydrofolate cyclohydrolase FolD [Candidatus Neomarinimicrobiota bacterium]MDX9779457.1 bifunctional methylenetetrahydrofolate dehydrogenase/methenyltetrahydrofolate cyclohydrolase FolD [bacterium]